MLTPINDIFITDDVIVKIQKVFGHPLLVSLEHMVGVVSSKEKKKKH